MPPSRMKFELRFTDRLGIVADIATFMSRHGQNIVSMEVRKMGGEAWIYLEVEGAEPAAADLVLPMTGLAGALEVRPIQTLPHEKRERRFQAVLDNVSDGIIAIDADGRATTMNRVAQNIFGNDAETREPSGEGWTVAATELALPECLNGASYVNVKKSVITTRGRFRFLATAKPIRDAGGRVVGAVAILKDLREVREMAHAAGQAPIRVSFGDFVGKSMVIREVIAVARKIATTDAIVSIRGESGTGKELFAGAIHTDSGRKGPFVPVNCAALPETLLESELFGYSAGAFTGATQRGKMGVIEQANGGTVFLDEIGELPLNAQAKIRRLIQERRVRRIGAAQEIPVDTRVITATNKDLERMVREGSFREDLYYRVNVLPIHIPPLRERSEDIPSLAAHFLFQLEARLGKGRYALTEGALAKLRRHTWPGNVRELKNVIERAAILSDDGAIPESAILFSFELARKSPLPSLAPVSESRSLKSLMDEHEKQYLSAALSTTASVREAARRMGLSHTALLNKMKKHGIRVERRLA